MKLVKSISRIVIHIDERCTSLGSFLGLTIRQKDRNPTWPPGPFFKAWTGLDYFGSCQNAGARQLDGYGMVFSFIPKLDSSSMSLGFIKVGNHSWLVVKKPSCKMMEFVNWKDDIPYMIWKIKFMFETTNQIVYSVTLPKTPGFTFLRPTFCQNIRKRTGIHQDLRPDVGIVTRMTCNHKNKPANFLPAMLLIHWARHWARPSCAPAAPGAWNCFGQVRFGIAESLATGRP